MDGAYSKQKRLGVQLPVAVLVHNLGLHAAYGAPGNADAEIGAEVVVACAVGVRHQAGLDRKGGGQVPVVQVMGNRHVQTF